MSQTLYSVFKNTTIDKVDMMSVLIEIKDQYKTDV